MAGDIDRALAFMHACGADPEEFRRVDLYAGHEALLLDYERALTRIDSRTGLPYDVSGHFVWIGERTRAARRRPRRLRRARPQPDRGQGRPDGDAGGGARAGRPARPRPRAGPAHAHHPDGRGPGPRRLPPLVEKVTARGDSGRVGLRPDARQHLRGGDRAQDPVASTTSSTRCAGFFEVHRALGTYPGGIHVELTGDDVTECVGGGQRASPSDLLGDRYETACDPRLNREQALELAFLVAEMLAAR